MCVCVSEFVMASTEDHKVCRGAPWIDDKKKKKLYPFFEGYSTLRLVCFGLFIIFLNLKTDELTAMLPL